MSRITSPALLAFALIASACSSDDGGGLPPAPTPDTGGTDTTPPPDDATPGEDAAPGDDTAEPVDGGEDAGDAGPVEPADPFAASFLECATTADCGPAGGAAQVCVEGVCVIPAPTQATLAEEVTTVIDPDSPGTGTETTITAKPGEAVVVDCFSDGSLTELTDGPATATLEGYIERFGSGQATNRLCMVAYEHDALLRWLTSSDCEPLRETDEDLYVACYQLDPCRCDEAFIEDQSYPALNAMLDGASEAFDENIDSLDTCYAFLGHCEGIEDDETRAACTARVQERTASTTRESLVLGHTRSTPNEVNPDWGYFELPNIPTNTLLAFKTSGDESRWVDTYRYGVFARAGLVSEGRIRIDANAVTFGTWNTIPSSLGIAGGISPLNGAVAGAVRDCGVPGVRPPWNVVGATVGLSFQSNSTALEYFNGVPSNPLPQPGREGTNIDALYAAINLPAGRNRVAPTICTANCDGSGGDPVYTFAGALNVFQTPKSVIIASFEGIRDNER